MRFLEILEANNKSFSRVSNLFILFRLKVENLTMATKQEEGQVEAEAGKDEVLVRSVRERDRWLQLRNLQLNFQLGLIDLQDLEEELKLKPQLKEPPS